MDAVGIPDAPGDEAATTAYATAFGGVSFVNPGGEPESVFREAATGDWYAHWPFATTTFPVTDLSGADVNPALFDIDPTLGPTFGSTNPALAIPEPSSVIALAAFGVAGVVRRRHRSS